MKNLWLSALFFLAVPLSAADDVKLPAPEKFHLYLLIGQSNMAGRGKITAEDKIAPPRVLKFTKDQTWAPATDPLHFDKPIAGVGLGTSFGREMAAADEGIVIGLIPCAVGGTPLARWEKDGDLFRQAIARTRAAQKVGTLQGILWHQGESDSGSAQTAENYGERLSGMVQSLRAELKADKVPFVAGELGRFLQNEKAGKPSFWQKVNEQIHTLPERVEHTAVVSSKDLTDQGDKVHFDRDSLQEFGQRYALKMLELQPPLPK